MNSVIDIKQENPASWQQKVVAIGPQISINDLHDQTADLFTNETFNLLRSTGILTMIIPENLGGGGASFNELKAVMSDIRKYSKTTAKAFSIFMHPVTLNVYWHLRGDYQATDTLRELARKFSTQPVSEQPGSIEAETRPQSMHCLQATP